MSEDDRWRMLFRILWIIYEVLVSGRRQSDNDTRSQFNQEWKQAAGLWKD